MPFKILISHISILSHIPISFYLQYIIKLIKLFFIKKPFVIKNPFVNLLILDSVKLRLFYFGRYFPKEFSFLLKPLFLLFYILLIYIKF